MNDTKKELIALEVIKVLKSRFDSYPNNETSIRNAPFHKAFLNAFKDLIETDDNSVSKLISMSSWMHGLSTTLGQNFFENVAQILCDGEKKTFNDKKIYLAQQTAISEIMTSLKNGNSIPNAENENKILNNTASGEMVPATNFTVDCFFVSVSSVTAIELKSVRPNSGEMKGEKQKILTGKAVLKTLFPDKDVNYYFGFPFDPISNTDVGYNKEEFMNYIIEFKKFCDPNEILLADELWSSLSGEEGTMQDILDIINSIATVNFNDEYNFLNNADEIRTYAGEYNEIINRWFLKSERRIFENLSTILEQSKTNTTICKLFNQEIFKDGKYNRKRVDGLKEQMWDW